MRAHVCPWWGGYFIDNSLRRWLHHPQRILSEYLRGGMTVMDFGCGMGLFSIAGAQLVGDQGRMIAVDLQQKMLDVLRKRAAKAGVADRIHTHRCGKDSLDWYESVDFALAFYSIHEVPDQRKLLGEIHGCLQPRGRMLVVEPIGHVTATAFEGMMEVARQVGFQEETRPRIRWSHTALLHPRPTGA